MTLIAAWCVREDYYGVWGLSELTAMSLTVTKQVRRYIWFSLYMYKWMNEWIIQYTEVFIDFPILSDLQPQ